MAKTKATTTGAKGTKGSGARKAAPPKGAVKGAAKAAKAVKGAPRAPKRKTARASRKAAGPKAFPTFAVGDRALVADVDVRVEAGDIAASACDAIVVNLFQGVTKPAGATGALDAATGGAISTFLATGDFKGKLGEIAVLYPDGVKAKRVLLAGLGKEKDFDVDKVRRVSAKVAQKARALDVKALHTIVHGAGIGGIDPERAAEAVAEGTILGLYRFDVYRGMESKRKEQEQASEGGSAATKGPDSMVIVEHDASRIDAIRTGAARGRAVATSVNWTRTLGTLSGVEAIPATIADHANDLKKLGVKVRILKKRDIEKEKMGAFLGVNRGSIHEPRFVIMEHGKKGKDTPTIALVGKGITFDTGGISLKPGPKMEDMKFDKCGAAAVFGIMRAAALLDLPLHIVGVTPFTENMPGGNAYKPGDVLIAKNGKTIEVQNTDAEGRLILADALCWVDENLKPGAVLDYATLTGAVSVALGTQAMGIMGNNEDLLRELHDAGNRTHERAWALPFYDEYDEQIKSKIADVKNIGGKNAGAITAGKFLSHFIGDWPWVHLDIAAVAWNDDSPGFNKDYSPEQATGAGVRLTVDWLRARAADL